MNKAYLLAIPILFVVGFFAYSNRTALLNSIEPVTSVLSTGFAKAQNLIPEPIRPYIIPVGLGAFGLFMTWAKMAWQKKAVQTEIRAAQQQNQMQGELTEAQKVNTNLQGTIKTLSTQPASASTLELEKALLTNETKDIRIRDLEQKIQDLQRLVADLKLDNKALEIRLKELTTIA